MSPLSALGPIEVLFLLGALVVVPVALRLVAGAEQATPWLRAARRLQPWAALAVAASFLLGHRGPAAGLLAATWVPVTLLVALHGFQRLRRGPWIWAEVATDAGCLMLPIGGGWLVLSRLGVTVLGFEEPIPLLTAVHFHFAAFATLMLVGLAGRFMGEPPVYRLIVAGTISGPPLLAAGITLSPWIEIVAAAILVLAVAALAVLTLVRMVPRVGGLARGLLVISSLSALGAMACALAYALGRFSGVATISLGQMARIHGPLNGLGFVLGGLLAWTITPRRS